MYELKTSSGLTWVENPVLTNTGLVTHAFSTRWGGFSRYPWQSLNLGLYSGDDLATVQRNRTRFAANFNIEPFDVVSPHFVHSNVVLDVDDAHRGMGYLEPSSHPGDADAMVTKTPNLALFVTFADCAPIFFLDPEARVIGCAHSGWKGTMSGISQAVVERMVSGYGADPARILAVVGPTIGGADFEVGSDVIEAVQAQAKVWMAFLSPSRPGRAYFDLQKAIVWQLHSVGLRMANIYAVQLSTFARNDLFFSHRRSAGVSGRMGGLIMLKGE